MASAVSRATAPTRGKLPASPTAPVRPAPRPAPPRPHAGMLRSAPPAMRLGSAARSVGGGAPLPDAVRPALENGFGVDLEPVRVHTDTRAQSAARNLSARAFAFGPDIFLGSGERPVDLRLMAHESAHVLQQQRMTAVQPWSPFGTNRYEAEANRASSAVASGGRFTVFEQLAGPRVQRAESGKTLNYLADQANLIPGFRLFTIILGANPINDQRVDRSAANILRAMFEFLPGGTLISEALANNGVFDKVGAWIEQQLQSLGLVGGQIKAAVAAFIDSLGVKDLFDLGGAWSRAKRIFSEPVDRILIFVKGLVTGIVKFIKEAILLPLASLAQKTRGWDLLIAVLGKNPITDEVVPRTAETLIGGFMKLIGEEEVWENMKKANAIGRAWAWFQGALATVVGFVRMVPQLFLAALASLEVADIVLVPRAYLKVGLVFAGFAVQFVTWAGEAVWRLLEIIFESVKPGALDYIKKTGSALKSILKNPLPFVGNLVKAAKLGFTNFADHFGTHLKAGLIDWLTGSLPGVYIPKGFTLVEIVKFALSMLGISWANIRGKLVKVVGDPAVSAMETGFTIVKKLVTEGPAAAWAEIKDQLSGLKDQVIDGIIRMVVEMIAMKAIPKLIAMFIPGAGFLSAIISIYDTIVVFVERIKKIAEVVTSFVDSIVAIAGGAIGAAANRVERALAGLVSLAIGFLACFAGLGKVSDKVMGVIQKVRGTVDKGIDALIAWIVKMAKKVGGFATDKARGAVRAILKWWGVRKAFRASDGSSHSLYFQGEGTAAILTVATIPIPVRSVLERIPESVIKTAQPNVQKAYKDSHKCVKRVEQQTKIIQGRDAHFADELTRRTQIDKLNTVFEELTKRLELLMPLISPPTTSTTTPSGVDPEVLALFTPKKQLIKITRSNKVALVTEITSEKLVRFALVRPGRMQNVPTGILHDKYRTEFTRYTEDPRALYLGPNPERNENNVVFKTVKSRMKREGKYNPQTKMVLYHGVWHPESNCDMSHIVDAVLWWNSNGRFTGPQSRTVIQFMTDPSNYELEPKEPNQQRGRSLANRGVHYLEPVL